MKQRTLQEREKLVALHNTSGLSQVAFCKQHDINPATFSSWKQKLRQVDTNDITPDKNHFFELPIKATTPTPTQSPVNIELHFPHGIRLIIKEGV